MSAGREQHNIEWKREWKEEYMRWICGFANAQGGTLYIGKDDTGVVTGIPDAKKLLTDIPNKVRDILGIIVDINLQTENGKEYLEIVVMPHSYPVNYKGEYHYRSGSTKQLLQGAVLTQFLCEKTGTTWDSIPLDGIALEDFWRESFDIFRKQAILSKRMDETDVQMSNPLPEYTVYPEDITVMFRCRQWERITAVREATYILEHEYRQNTDMNTVSDKKTAEKVLAFLKLNPEATQKEISERLHITQRTTERAIAALKEQKRIIRIGNNRTGHWIVMDNGS